MFAQAKQYLKRYDFSFFGMAMVIFAVGVLNLHSATHATYSEELRDLYKTQIAWFGVAMSVGICFSFIHPKNLYRFSYIFYAINVVLLILVLVMGKKVMGATRWLAIGSFRMQPSEFMKFAVVLTLARWFVRVDPDGEIGLKEMILPFFIAFFPAILIIVQPDLGTGLLILLIFFVMIFYRKLKIKTLFILFFIGLITGLVTYKFGLKEYQRQRIITFIDPQADAQGSGYNAIQSEIAIGSGQVFGKGYKKSSQASLNYLPENHTDFVFSVFNEEHGFVGSVFLIALYVVFLLRFIWLSTVVLQFYDSLLTIGIMSIIFWHSFINMGMVTGLMPIVGLPLPLMSYGGSSLLTIGVCLGIVTSISNTRKIF